MDKNENENENENEKNIFTPMTEEKRKVLERPLGSSSKPLNYKELENVDKNFYESFQGRYCNSSIHLNTSQYIEKVYTD